MKYSRESWQEIYDQAIYSNILYYFKSGASEYFLNAERFNSEIAYICLL